VCVEILGGSKKIDPPLDTPVRIPSIALFGAASEVDDGAEREPRAIGCAAGIMQANVVELRAQCQMRQNAQIHSAANAIRKVGIGAAAVAES